MIPILFSIILLGTLMLMIVKLVFDYMVKIQFNHNQVIRTNLNAVKFPLGDLSFWKDLLQLNKTLLNQFENTNDVKPIAQYIFYKQCIAVIDGQHVYDVLMSSKSRSLAPKILNFAGLFHIKKFMGSNSVGIAEGQTHSLYRQAFGSSLKTTYLTSIYSKITNIIKESMDYLQSNQNFDITELMHFLTLDVVCFVMFKETFGALDTLTKNKKSKVIEAFDYQQYEMARRISSFDLRDWIYEIPFEKNRKLNEANTITREAVAHVIKQRELKEMKIDDEDLIRAFTPVGDSNAMFNKLNNTSRKDKVSDVLIDNILTGLWAGSDTSATCCSTCFYLLSRYPEIQDKLRSSIISLEKNDIVTNKYLDAVVWETLRLHPPAIFTNRGFVKDLDLQIINGSNKETLHLKKGSQAFVLIWAVHRSKKNWGENANNFDPEDHFLTNKYIAKKGILCPFGLGIRSCPGKNLALVEVKTIIANFVKNFKFEPPANLSDPTFESLGMFQTIKNNRLKITKLY